MKRHIEQVTQTHLVFNLDLVRQRLVRASSAPETFLLDRVAEDMADRLGAIMRPFHHVLDVLTPSPLLADKLRPQHLRRIVLDAALGGTGSWTSVPMTDEIVPPADRPFDLAVSGLGLQFINDLPGLLVQIRQALKPDGLFLGAMIGGQSLHELRSAFTEAESEISGGASPRVAPFADLRDMGGLLQRAGFALPVTDIDTVTVRYSDLFALMRDLRAMGATNALISRSRRFLRRDILARAAAIYAERFSDRDGRIRATFEIIWLSGWVPDPSQQQPLKPGSAKMRLAEALRVPEGKV
eukprot:gene16863-17048_t